jgi:sulfhydrogenase subunit delta
MKPGIKPKIAFFDFAGCEGCQLTVIDSLQRHPALVDVVDIVQFREAMSEKSNDYQIAFVEGSCTRLQDEIRLKEIRQNAEIVFALGACAHLGGVNALRNWQSQEEVERYVYGSMTMNHEPYPGAPIDSVIPIDGFIPGCPIDREEFIKCVTALLQGRRLPIPDYPVCVECKLQENVCVFNFGKSCLGPITRAGCGATCPSNGVGCDGCRGKVTSANTEGMKIALAEHGFNTHVYSSQIKLFQSYQLSPNKREAYGYQKTE